MKRTSNPGSPVCRANIILVVCLILWQIANAGVVLGDGLKGEYFDNSNLSTLMVTRIDPQVNFDWGLGAPAPSMGIDNFSVRWTGQVQAIFSEKYTFYTYSNDGARLWVNGRLLISSWIDQLATQRSGSIALVAGQKYDIRMEFYDHNTLAVAKLSWSSPSQVKQIIPSSQLFSPSSGSNGFVWQTASPESQGMSRARLDIMRNVLANRDTKTFLVVRNDRIVYEWYAPGWTAAQKHREASLAKAVVGGMSLVVALNDGRIGVDDLAGKYIAPWRNDALKSKIRIRQLASHTSGIEDAEGPEAWKKDFWRRIPDPFSIAIEDAPCLFVPGSDMAYSNPGFAALAYAVTAAYGSDIRTLLRERIMRPIGVLDTEWGIGYLATYRVDGLNLVTTWGGAGYTPRALARVGRLMLRKGNWEGNQLFSSTWASRMVARAVPVSDSGLCWWTNLDGGWPVLPRDAFGGAGSDHQLLFVVPSLDLIVVRNGGELMNQDDFWAGPEQYVFEPLMNAITNR